MDAIAERTTEAILTDVLASRPQVRAHLDAAWNAAWDCVDPVLLELCRLRVAMLLRCDAEMNSRTDVATAAGLDEKTIAALADWPISDRFGPRERACLAFAEQFVIDVAGLDTATADGVREGLGDAGLIDFTNALLVIEQRIRRRLVWTRLFASPGSADPAQ